MLNIYLLIYILSTLHIYNILLVYWREVSVIVSMNSPKVALTFFGIAMVDWQIRQTHFEYDIVKKSPPPIPDGIVVFGFLLGPASPLIFISFLY